MPKLRPLARLARGGVLAAALAGTLAGCAQPWQRVSAGQDASQVVATLGPARERYPLGNGVERLLWPTQPFGETTTAADIDSSGRVLAVQQVLTNESFGAATIDGWTRDDVLHHFGKPVETSYFPLMKREVWTYRYMDADVWYMMYSFYFSDDGILRSTQKSPDPLHDPDRREWF
ncbi:hypothetical protein [Chitinasiproducens palmae]|uniref:Lipoprotein n=1 Tax=Chitinasiproducens palmae TaxID=1770053 RepID=A0A1H2PSL4_9BURK|nr:hypothetical protein [Chitinasiproducens palmae]SDV50018.1 hypothetical protein SAMN05216551_11056 [Chitinasiproducens palmae]